jgi:hypothetical protein
LAGTALAVSSKTSPASLVFARSDFAATPREYFLRPPTKGLQVFGIPGLTARESTAQLLAGGAVAGLPKAWWIDSGAAVTSDEGGARRFFSLNKPTYGFGSSPQNPVRVKLRAYGDEQVSAFSTKGFTRAATIFVRKDNVAWYVTIRAIQWPVTKAQLLAQLNVYAAKLKQKVGVR